MFLLIDPSTQQEFNLGYYIFTGLIAAFLGFIATYFVIHFYDHSRPHPAQEDEEGNKLAAKRVGIGMAVASALCWIMLRRICGGP
jgi:drug/metabolite transporter (DMT)-like permease